MKINVRPSSGALFSSSGLWVLVLAAGLLLRARALGDVGIFGDEYYHIFNAVRFDGFRRFLGLARENPNHLLLDPLQTFLLARVSGRLWWLRSASVFWGLAAVVGLGRLCESTRDRSLGLAAAALLAFSPLHIEWSRRVDFYALLTALAVWQTAALLRLADDSRAWKPYAAWSALFLHAHPYAIMLGVLHAVYLGAAPGLPSRMAALRAFLRAWFVAGVLFVPWFLFSAAALTHGSASDFTTVIARLPLRRFLRDTPLVLSFASDFYDPFASGGALLPWLAAGSCVLLYLRSLIAARRGAVPRAVLFAHLAIPLGLALVVAADRTYGFFYAPRQLIWLLPFYLLAVAHGGRMLLEAAGRRFGAVVGAALATAAAGLFLFAALPASLESTWSQERELRACRETGDYARRFVEKDDVFIFENSVVAEVFFYHFDPAGAFRIFEGFRPARGGTDYRVPDVVRVGKFQNLAVVGHAPFSEADGIDRSRVWWIGGEDFDWSLYPPRRRR